MHTFRILLSYPVSPWCLCQCQVRRRFHGSTLVSEQLQTFQSEEPALHLCSAVSADITVQVTTVYYSDHKQYYNIHFVTVAYHLNRLIFAMQPRAINFLQN